MSHSADAAPFAVLWLGWLGYWMVAARNVKATRRSEPYASRISRVVLILLAAALMAFHRQPFAWLGSRFLPGVAAVYWVGLLVTAAGIAFSIWARVNLGRNWSGLVTVKDDHELIRSGPYGLVRHPIYTGLLLSVLGTAVAFGEWRGSIAFALLTVSFVIKLRVEERFMSETFGEQYQRYRAKVPALIPFIV